MTQLAELRSSLIAIARRSVGLTKACNNEESVRLYLVLPVLGLLGYDATDPLEVYPHHETDAIDGRVYKADFAILNAGMPQIAVGVARTAADRAAKHPALGQYFSAWRSTKLAVITNGILYEFFVDSVRPGAMDEEPFLTLDLATVAQGGIADEVMETLFFATKTAFDPDTIAERAHLQLVKRRLRTAFMHEGQAPSERLVRTMMEAIGFPNAPKAAIDRHYAPLAKAAWEEALVLPVVQKLRATGGMGGEFAAVAASASSAEREAALFNMIRRRLAYLADSEAQFHAIERVDFRDNVGKLVVFVDSDPRGRLVEIIRGVDGTNKYIFPDGAEVVAADLASVDAALRSAFVTRVGELTRAAAA